MLKFEIWHLNKGEKTCVNITFKYQIYNASIFAFVNYYNLGILKRMAETIMLIFFLICRDMAGVVRT